MSGIHDDGRSIDALVPGMYEALEVLSSNLDALQSTLASGGGMITPEILRMAAAIMRTGADEFDKLREAMETAS